MDRSPEQMLEQLASAERRAERRARAQVGRTWTVCGVPLLLGGVALDQISPAGLALLIQVIVLVVFLGIAYSWTLRSGIRMTREAQPFFPFWLPGVIVLAGGLARVLFSEFAPAWTNTISGGVIAAGFITMGWLIGRAPDGS